MNYLSAPLRIYIYALHGIAAEVLYTCLWELVFNWNLKLPGNSHFWAFLIYGLFIFAIEKCQGYLRDTVGLPLALRCLVYAIFALAWEFSCGILLRQINACAWDYAPWFHYNVMGLITFEYLPLWYFSSMVAEKILIHYTLRLCFSDKEQSYPQAISRKKKK